MILGEHALDHIAAVLELDGRGALAVLGAVLGMVLGQVFLRSLDLTHALATPAPNSRRRQWQLCLGCSQGTGAIVSRRFEGRVVGCVGVDNGAGCCRVSLALDTFLALVSKHKLDDYLK